MALSTLLNRFYENARSAPDSVALFYDGRSLTYGKLCELIEEGASKIARLAQDNDRNTPVCLFGNDKLKLALLQLSVLRAGLFFVTIDYQTSKAILVNQLQQLGVELSIVANLDKPFGDEWKQAQLPGQVVGVDDLDEMQSGAALPENIQDEALAYILLTSGSTGKPKAVMQTHLGLFQQMQRYYRIIGIENNVGECFSNFAPLFHDQGIVDLFGALLSPKAKLCMFDLNKIFISDAGLNAARDFMSDQQVTIFSGLPEVFKLIFSNQPKHRFPNLRIVAIGADTVGIDHVMIYLKSCPDSSKLCNSHGATECSWVTGWLMTKEEAQRLLAGLSVPIGFPESTLSVLIRDPDVQGVSQVAPGSIGELCIAGEGVSPGYFKNKNATADSFFTFNEKWFYATGDLVVEENGILLHKGRLARLEKISGKRVDINELEQHIAHILSVDTYIVVSLEANGEKFLCGFMQDPNQSSTPTWSLGSKNLLLEKELKQHLIPSYLFVVSEFPKLGSGKIDRGKLKLIASECLKDDRVFVGTDLEKQIFAAVSKTSNMMRIENWNISFLQFMTSLQCAIFILTLNEFLGGELVYFSDVLMKDSTPEKLAKILEKRIENRKDPQKINIEYYAGSLVVNFSYAMICRMFSYFMEKNTRLKLSACISVKDFVNKIKTDSELGFERIGYTVPIPYGENRCTDDNRESHPVACLVDYHPNKKLTIWISDSAGLDSSYFSRITDFLKKSGVSVELYYDASTRQAERDYFNCVFDAFSFLTNAFFKLTPSSDWVLPSSNYFSPPKHAIHCVPDFLDSLKNGRLPSKSYALDNLAEFYSKLIVDRVQGKTPGEIVEKNHVNDDSSDAVQEKTSGETVEKNHVNDDSSDAVQEKTSGELIDIIPAGIPGGVDKEKGVNDDDSDIEFARDDSNDSYCYDISELYADSTQNEALRNSFSEVCSGSDLREKFLNLQSKFTTPEEFKVKIIDYLKNNMWLIQDAVDMSRALSCFTPDECQKIGNLLRDRLQSIIDRGRNFYFLIAYLNNQQIMAVCSVLKGFRWFSPHSAMSSFFPELFSVLPSRHFDVVLEAFKEGLSVWQWWGIESIKELLQNRDIQQQEKLLEVLGDQFWLNVLCCYQKRPEVTLSSLTTFLSPRILIKIPSEENDLVQLRDQPDLYALIQSKISEKKAIEVFFSVCPNWCEKTILEVSGIEEILTPLNNSVPFSPSFFGNSSFNTNSAIKDALTLCGIDLAALDAEPDIKKKAEQVIFQLNKYKENVEGAGFRNSGK